MSTENSGKNKGNVENLKPHQFKPGESGNPGGRPKKAPITDRLLVQLEKPLPARMKAKLPSLFADVYGEDATFTDLLALRLIEACTDGSLKALALILDRVEGKVPQGLRLAGESAEPVVFRVIRCDV